MTLHAPNIAVPTPLKRPFHLLGLIRRAMWSAVDHDCFNMAQATAYSAVFALFPALIVAAAVVALVPDTLPLRYQLAVFFDRVLPGSVSLLFQTYFTASPKNTHSARVLIGAIIVSITGAASVIGTLMEGLRRAQNLPADTWTFWQRRRKSFALIPLCLLPLAIASILVVFGHIITLWLMQYAPTDLHTMGYAVASILRWSVALAGTASIIAVIYHLGTPTALSWRRSLPGAVFATAMWLLTTISFGWYVTNFANYTVVYGSIGAAIALLVWLYITALSVLCGAELNAQIYPPPPSPEVQVPAGQSVAAHPPPQQVE